MEVVNWYRKAQLNLGFGSDSRQMELFPVERTPGVYLTHSRTMANAYANGRVRDAHLGANRVYNGVIFEVVLDDEEQHIPGDVWHGGWRDELVEELKTYQKTKQVGDTMRQVLDACGIPPRNLQSNLVAQWIKDPERLFSSMSHQQWSSLQDEGQAYSEIVMDDVPWDKIHKIYVYDRQGNLEKVMDGGKPMTDEEFAYQEEAGNVYYHGSPRSNWKQYGL